MIRARAFARLRAVGFFTVVLALAGCVMPSADEEELATGVKAKQEVLATERAFAKTMADRDFDAFSRYVSEDAIFFSGTTPLHGKQAVLDRWRKYFSAPQAPFSWEPAEVEALASGRLALSSGPVRDPAGKLIGTFTSIWRLEAPHTWRIVFDKGNPVCD